MVFKSLDCFFWLGCACGRAEVQADKSSCSVGFVA